MKPRFLMPLFVSIFIAFFASFTLQAQHDLTKENAFFQKAGKEYQGFLEHTELNTILRLDSVQTFSDIIILNLVMTNYSDWANLSRQYEKDFGVNVRQMLFNKAAFLFEIDEDSLGIRIWSPDFTLVEVQLLYYDDKLSVIENVDKAVRLDSLVLEKKRLPKIAKQNTYKSIEICKDKIEKELKKHYKKESEAVKIETNTARPNELKLKIWNIRGEILHDSWLFPYWEYITIKVTFKEQGGKFIVFYEVQAKYGSGIFRGPRLSDYTDMDSDYKSYVDDYMEKLSEIIYKAIK
jgi:hypothetical protein